MRNKFLGTGEPGFRPIHKTRVIFAGLRFAVLYDFSVAYKLVLSAVVLALAYVFRAWTDAVVVWLATGAMLTAEIFNTSIEALCDYLQPELDERIRVIKDMCSAATGVAIAVWYGVLLHEGYEVWLILRG